LLWLQSPSYMADLLNATGKLANLPQTHADVNRQGLRITE